jgi:hypothetical protein
MSWLIGWLLVSVGVVIGFLLAALLRANDERPSSGGFVPKAGDDE